MSSNSEMFFVLISLFSTFFAVYSPVVLVLVVYGGRAFIKIILVNIRMSLIFTPMFYIIKSKMRAIKEELGDNDDDEDDLAALERKMQSAGMPPNVWKHAQRELR